MPALTPAPSLKLSSASSTAPGFFYWCIDSYEPPVLGVQNKPALTFISVFCVTFWHQFIHFVFAGNRPDCPLPLAAVSSTRSGG
jgi:hypothetical protein